MRTLLLLASAALAVSACSSTGPGQAKTFAPDEFSVVTKPPLSVPPDYSLRPPKPGETRPDELTTTERTEQLLLGDTSATPPSNGELAFVQSAGALEVDPSIRAILDAENGGRVEKDESLANRLMFWNYDNGEVDDSAAPLVVEDREGWLEQRRKSIESVTGPGATVTIAEDKRGILRLPGVQ